MKIESDVKKKVLPSPELFNPLSPQLKLPEQSYINHFKKFG